MNSPGKPPSAAGASLASGTSPESFWLDGGAVLCACPGCAAPMTVRLWLMIADCWRCGASIELSEEQEREIQRLIEGQEKAPGAPEAPATRPTPRPRAPVTREVPTKNLPAAPTPPASPDGSPANSSPSAPPPPPPPPTARRSARPIRRRVAVGIADAIHGLPAWLVSLILHLVALLILAILTLPSDDDPQFITLTTSIYPNPTTGGEVTVANPFAVQIDLPVPDNVDLNDVAVRSAIVKADQDARELRLDSDAVDPNLPQLDQLKRRIGAAESRPAIAARDPRLRAEMVRKEGGTTFSEAAVARGLRWLAMHQDVDGKWSLNGFNRSGGCTCGGAGIHSDMAGTSLALLPFLGAGQTHLVGIYRDNVAKGVRFMMQQQKPDGDLRGASQGNAGMYAHGQATIVLCEAYAMTGDAALRDAAQRAVQFIAKAQHERGGWRYAPGQPGDTSVFGWQLMALQSAKSADLDVPDSVFELADQYLDSCQHDGGAQYGYMPRNGPTHIMTAEALLCRMYLGWTLDHPALARGANFMVRQHPPSRDEPNIYYWYYGTQALHHFGGTPWEDWNRRIREILIDSQEKSGHAAGSWPPRGPHSDAGGRIYQTALSVCTLEVYYRHLPIFRQLKLD